MHNTKGNADIDNLTEFAEENKAEAKAQGSGMTSSVVVLV